MALYGDSGKLGGVDALGRLQASAVMGTICRPLDLQTLGIPLAFRSPGS